MIPPRVVPLAQEALQAAGVRAGLSPALLALLPRFESLFALVSADASGLACFGGELRLEPREVAIHGRATMSATGSGFDPASALTSLLGEAADLFSPFEREGDLSAEEDLEEFNGGWLTALTAAAAGPLDWVEGRDVADGLRLRVPADLALCREPGRRALVVRHALSSGVAAGPTEEAALQRATLELIERDAAARWWLEGGPGLALPAGSEAARAFERSLTRLRGGTANRPAMALVLPSPTGVPVVAALSRGADGHGLACGLAARADGVAAIEAALVEMAQMEMSAPIARMKADRVGGTGLDAADRRHLARAALNAALLPQLRPAGLAQLPRIDGTITAHVTRQGFRLTAVNLTRGDIGVPVCRAISPDLRPFVFLTDEAAPY